MRSQFVDKLLREDEEPDFEGMFKAAAVSVEWKSVQYPAFLSQVDTVKFGDSLDYFSYREIQFDTKQKEDGRLSLFRVHFCKKSSPYALVFSAFELYTHDKDRVILPLETLKEVTENWIRTVWHPIHRRGIDIERLIFRFDLQQALRKSSQL